MSDDMKNILFLDKACTGCMVCEKICPTHAISLVWKGGGGIGILI